MKKTAKKLAALLLCLAVCLSFAGCAADVGTGLLVMKACEAMAGVESFGFDAKADAMGRALDEDVKLMAGAKGVCVIDPTVVQAETEFMIDDVDDDDDDDDDDTLRAPVYVVSENGGMTLYVGVSILTRTMWIKQTLAPSEDAFSGGVEEFIQYMKENVKSITRGEAAEINGKAAVPLTVVIPGQVLPAAGQTGTAARPQELTVVIWIDKESSLPVRLESEMDDVAQYYLDGMDLSFMNGTKVESLKVTVDLSDFNTVDAITLPESTKDAVVA